MDAEKMQKATMFGGFTLTQRAGWAVKVCSDVTVSGMSVVTEYTSLRDTVLSPSFTLFKAAPLCRDVLSSFNYLYRTHMHTRTYARAPCKEGNFIILSGTKAAETIRISLFLCDELLQSSCGSDCDAPAASSAPSVVNITSDKHYVSSVGE